MADRIKMDPRIQLFVRNAECEDCRLCEYAQGLDRCVTASGAHDADILVVSKNAWTGRTLKEVGTYLKRVGFDLKRCAFTSAIKCRAWETDANRTDIKACKQYLAREIEFIKPDMVIALGNEALMAAAGKSGIMKHRGQTYEGPHGTPVIATISPAMVHRNPGQKAGFEADLRYIHARVSGEDLEAKHKPQIYKVANTKTAIREMIRDIVAHDGVSFDIESTGFDEFAPDGRIVSIAFTLFNHNSKTSQITWALPLYHPESPWRKAWKSVLKVIGTYVSQSHKRVAHNGKFDCRWLRQFGWPNIDLTFDTMLAAHTLDENRPKGLKPLAQSIHGVPPWAIDTKDLLDTPLEEVLWYNALDTYHTCNLYFHFKDQFKLPENARKARLFARLIMPASNEFIPTERAGVWVDQAALQQNWKISRDTLQGIDDQLRAYVPDDHPFQVYYRDGRLKKDGINFGPSNFQKWWLFDHLGLPVIARGKRKDNGDPGAPSTAEAVMLALKGQHPAIELLLERTKWYKYCTAFFSAYAEQLDRSSRIHTNFKVTGTVTGRLSSGKADADKVTGRKQIRGVNLQQVPRDSMVRGIFGAPPGSYFVEFDYSQIELRIAAYLAREETMLALYNSGADIHMAMAMRMTGKPKEHVTPHERKMAKAVNFGFLYGMGWRKFIATALANYGIAVGEHEAQGARTAFFDQFPDLLPWHARQRRLAHKFKRVETPLGRIRHLPDIDSPDRQVMAEAERQAINSPVQGLASDLALLSFVLVSRKFRAMGLRAHPIGTVHDAVNYEIPADEVATCLPIIKSTMENLPLEKFFNIRLDVPIIADCKIGTRWGGAQELTAEQVFNWDPSILEVKATNAV